jgi:type III secretion protein W
MFNTTTAPQKAAEVKSVANNESDNMEEISMKFSESIERNSKSLEKRTIKPQTQMRAEKLEALYKLLAGQGDQLHEEIQRILARGQQALSMEAFMSAANGDPTKAEVLLQHATHQTKTSGNHALLKTLQNISQELNEEHGQDILAGINTAEALAMYSQDPQQRQNMRNLYYRNIVGQGSLAAIFDTLLSQFDEKHFAQGIHTLMRALSDDISSLFPSKPGAQLKALLKDLTASQKLNSILNSSRDLLDRVSTQHPPQDMSAARLTKRLIDFTQGSLYPREIKSLSDDTVGQDPLKHVKFLNSLYPLVKEMPLPLWKDGESRRSALQVILRMMTEYTHYERQHLASTQANQVQQ